MEAVEVLCGKREVAVSPECRGVVEVSDDLLVTEVRVVLQTLLVQQRPVLDRLPRHGHVPRLEVRPVEEEGPEVGVRPILPVIGDVTLVVPALLQALVPSEGSPPDHEGNVGILDRTRPARADLTVHFILRLQHDVSPAQAPCQTSPQCSQRRSRLRLAQHQSAIQMSSGFGFERSMFGIQVSP